MEGPVLGDEEGTHVDGEEAEMGRHDREVERLHRDPGCTPDQTVKGQPACP